jgi:pimeloyl-ACP methyl ester carboxylesterase
VMSADVIRLMDHLGIESADLMGYSMGGYISLVTLLRHPERFRRVVLGGIGSLRSASARGRPNVVKALLAENAASVSDPVGKAFRVFAEASKNDLRALAACMRAGREPTTREQLAAITNPVLLVVGAKDDVIEEPEELAHAIPGCEFLSIPGRDHLTVVGDRRMKEAVAGFLKE